MLSDIQKSINAILYQRLTSPLFGAFTLSWAVWNWRILYMTFFIDAKELKVTKIRYIGEHYIDHWHIYVGPLLSTVFLVVLAPFAANGAYWLSIRFKQWRLDQKNAVEKKQLLTLEQSIALREQIRTTEERFEKLTANKDTEIRLLKAELEEARKRSQEEIEEAEPPTTETKPEPVESQVETQTLSKTEQGYEKFRQEKRNLKLFQPVVHAIQDDLIVQNILKDNDDRTAFDHFLINGLIEPDPRKMTGKYRLTQKGQDYYRLFLSRDEKEVNVTEDPTILKNKNGNDPNLPPQSDSMTKEERILFLRVAKYRDEFREYKWTSKEEEFLSILLAASNEIDTLDEFLETPTDLLRIKGFASYGLFNQSQKGWIITEKGRAYSLFFNAQIQREQKG